MPKKAQKVQKVRQMPESQARKREKYVIQALLKVDLEWISILLYSSRAAATRGMRKLERLEPIRHINGRDRPKHALRIKKWQGEELSILGERLLHLTVAA